MKKILFYSMFLFSALMMAQENYGVIVIPKKFDFQKSENQYNINTLCRLFFEKEGFKVINDEEMLEDDLYAKRCDFLYLNINDIGSIFTIKVNIDLKDCKKEVLLQSIDVKTKEKDYYKGYNEVVREALVSLRGKLAIPNKNSNKEEVVSNKVEEKTETIKSKTKEEKQSTSEVLTAESTKNGYNLLDSNNKLIFELLKTSNPSIFNAKKGSINGILTLNGNNAKFESYQNEVLIVEEFKVKF